MALALDNHNIDHLANHDQDEQAITVRDESTVGPKHTNIEILSSVEEVNTSNSKKRKRNSTNRPQDDSKAATFPISSIQIGSWKREARHDEEVIAKCYFKKKKLAWEVLNGKLKAKFEFSFYDIDAINSSFLQQKGILNIRLKKPPKFFCEQNPLPKKHTSWQECKDFTDQQVATKTRVHQLEFCRGVLEKYYSKIINSDRELLKVSTKEFPKDESHLFYQANGTISNFWAPQPPLPFRGHANGGVSREISHLSNTSGGARVYVDSHHQQQQLGNSNNNQSLELTTLTPSPSPYSANGHGRLLHEPSVMTYHPQLLTTSLPGVLNKANDNHIPFPDNHARMNGYSGMPISQFNSLFHAGLINNGFCGAPNNVDVTRLPPRT